MFYQINPVGFEEPRRRSRRTYPHWLKKENKLRKDFEDFLAVKKMMEEATKPKEDKKDDKKGMFESKSSFQMMIFFFIMTPVIGVINVYLTFGALKYAVEVAKQLAK